MWDNSEEGTGSDTAGDDPVSPHSPGGVVFLDNVESHVDDPATKVLRRRRSSLLDNVASEMLDKTSPLKASGRKKSRFFGLDDDELVQVDDGLTGAERVRNNLKRRQTVRTERALELQDRANRRHEVAQSRRQFLETKRDAQSAAMWMSILAAHVFACRLDNRREVHFAIDLFAKKLGPITRLKQMRIRKRHAKAEALNRANMTPPTAETLMKDPVLALFGLVHLRTVLPMLKPEFYMEGYNLMYEGEEGSDAFVITDGEVDIYIRSTDKEGNKISRWVATRGPGSVIGSIGMITGERRSARIRCRTNVVAHVIWRKDFISASTDDSVMHKALVEVTRQHETNIPKIFSEAVSGEGLSRYPIFKNIPIELLSQIRDNGLLKAKVIKPGEVLVNAGSFSTRLYFVLSGTVEFHREKKYTFVQPAIEVCANMTDVASTVTKNKRREYYSDASIDKGSLVASLGPRSLVGGPMFLLMEPYQLTVVARTAVDTLILESDDFLKLFMTDPASLQLARRNACEVMSQWMKPLSRVALLQSMFPDASLSFINPLRVARRHVFDLQPVVVNRGELLEYDAGSREAYLVVSGALEGTSASKGPFLWPPAPVHFFGSTLMTTRVTSRIEAWRSSRKNLLQVLRGVFAEDQLNKLWVDFFSKYEIAVGKPPVFEEIRGITVNNPLLGAAPPAPPPERHSKIIRKGKSTRRESSVSSDDERAAEAAASSDAVAPVVSTSANRTTPNRSRRSSVLVLDVSGDHETDSEEQCGTTGPPTTTAAESTSGRIHFPILPASYNIGRGRPPMRTAIHSALVSATKQRPTSPPQHHIQGQARDASPLPTVPVTRTAPPQLSDPYSRLFGSTDMADLLRDIEPGRTAPRGKVLLLTHPRAPTTARPVQHQVRLDDIRRTARGKRPAM